LEFTVLIYKQNYVSRVSDTSGIVPSEFESPIFTNIDFPFSAYDLMLSDAMNDLQEQVKVEHVPAEKNEQGVAVSALNS
jgi:hypothetical protein